MEKSQQTLVIAAIIALVVGGVVGYTMAPTKSVETTIEIETNPL
ncbi:unnamed protein product, partial [marine sediment metagenome]